MALVNLTDVLNGEDKVTIETIVNAMELSASDMHINVKATEVIAQGLPVMFTGYNVGLDKIEVAIADNTVAVAIGITSVALANGESGDIISNGVLDNIDTSSYTEGDILYANGGVLSNIEPTSGYSQPIAYVLKSNVSVGAIMITVDYPKQTADDVRYDNAVSGLSSVEVKGAIDEVEARLETAETAIGQLGSAVVLKGVWDASAGSFPTSTTAGDSWIVTIAGTVDGEIFNINDRVLAIIDSASTTVYANNWLKLDYTDEVISVDGNTGAITLASVYEAKDVTIVKDGDFTSNGVLNRTSNGVYNTLTIGSDIQAYDVDTAKLDVAQSFTEPQRTNIALFQDNSINFNQANNFELTATAADITVTTQTIGQSGTLVIASANLITGWGSEFDWGYQTVPLDLTGVETFAYYISGSIGADSIKIGRV